MAARLLAARRVTILTGAGVSAASGVPTFRGPDGLWRQYRPEDLATSTAFARNPELVWEWYGWRRAKVAACHPNAAHTVIAAWSASEAAEGGRIPADVMVLTQNVDDLHLRAGTRRLVRLHGSIWEMSCWGRCSAGASPWRDENVPLSPMPPRCPHCRGLARPAVVWFGESLRAADVESAIDAAACDVFLTVGTSAIVYPAAGLVHEARRHGAFTVEINPDDTAASTIVDVALHGGAEQILPELDRLAKQDAGARLRRPE